MTPDTLFEIREENELLRERVRQLEDALAPPGLSFPEEWKLTPSEDQLLRHLASRDFCTRESILLTLYSDRADECPGEHIIYVWVCKLRKKVCHAGVMIDTVRGRGYRLDHRQDFLRKVSA